MNISQINKYKKYTGNGTDSRSMVEMLANTYSEQEQQSISHFDILIESSRANTIFKDGVEYKCVVDYGNLPKKSGLSNLQHVYYREIMTKQSDNIKSGDVVEFAHNSYEDKKTYLLIKTIETRDGYGLSIMQDCNHNLKWIDKNGKVRSFPCLLFFNSRSNFGVKDDRIMSLPDGRRQIVVQRNEHTTNIRRNMRFMFGDDVFIAIDVDHLSENGISNIILKDDQYNPATDNMELGIADYYGRVVEDNGNEDDDTTPSEPSEGYSIVIKSTSDKPDEIKRNQSKEYYVEIRNYGNLVFEEDVIFDLLMDDKISPTNSASIVNRSNTTCTIKSNEMSGYIQLKATLKKDSDVVAWLRIKLAPLF